MLSDSDDNDSDEDNSRDSEGSSSSSNTPVNNKPAPLFMDREAKKML
jgi:hypothetical protein